MAVLIGWLWYASLGHRHVTAQARPAEFRNTADALQSTNARLVLAAADHFYWLNNGPAAAPLYARAEKLFSESGEKKNELHARIGRPRSEAETMSFVDLSRYLGEQLQPPLLRNDNGLRLWCRIAKGYTDIKIDYRATKRDGLEAKEIAKSQGQDQWVTRSNGELGLVAFLEGNPGRAARLMGGALLSTMASGDVGGEIRFLELLGRGFEEVNPHAEAIRFLDRAIRLANGEKDCGLPFMAYESKARALVATGKTNEARAVIEDALAKARAQQKRGHEAELLIILGTVAESTGDRTQRFSIWSRPGSSRPLSSSTEWKLTRCLNWQKLYRNSGDLASADARATQGLAASQRVGDRFLSRSSGLRAAEVERQDILNFMTDCYKQGLGSRTVYDKVIVVLQFFKRHGKTKLIESHDWPDYLDTIRPIYQADEIGPMLEYVDQDVFTRL